ncbi:MAG: hypothetical protein J5972_07545 [Eubacterium sp.]|nr:hypothetical protein [Eubacterium sp.]
MAGIIEYKCPCCGGVIEFDSASQSMKCPYCDTEFEAETLKNYDDVLKTEVPDDLTWDTTAGNEWNSEEAQNMNVYVCQTCGGEIIADATTAATKCPYCDNPVVMTSKLAGDLRPDYVIPFKLDKAAAMQAMKNHLMDKRLLPKVFKDENHIDEIKGIYVPFWLFDADADASIHYKATRKTFWSDSDYNYTKTSYYTAFRSGSVNFDNVPVDGSSQMPDDLMESIEPFDFSEAVDFQTAYLSGYLADRYDVSAEESINRANERVKKSTEDAFAATVEGYDHVVTENSSIQLKNGKSKYALYPVWTLHTTWNNQQFLFAMNGQTGKFVGNLPVDWRAYWGWFLGIAAGVSAAAFGILSLIWKFF